MPAGLLEFCCHVLLAGSMQPNVSLAVRRATREDAKLLTTMGEYLANFLTELSGYDTWVETWGNHYSEQDLNQYLTSSFTVPELESQLETEGPFWICFSGETPVGYVKVSSTVTLLIEQVRVKEQKQLPANCKHIELQRCYVYKAFHGTGAAQLLMNNALDYARAQGYEVVWLGVWGENHRAVKFYSKFGFEVFGSHGTFFCTCLIFVEFIAGDKVDIDLLVKLELKTISKE